MAELSSMDDGSWLRRGTVELRSAVLSVLARDEAVGVAALVSRLTGRPADVIASEHDASAVGVRTTPSIPLDALVCDVGAGTVDCITVNGSVVAAGGGELVTRAVAATLGIPRALAEVVKRGPCVRVEGPHLAHGEDGRRTFLDRVVSADLIGRLCVPAGTSHGLVAFADRLAPEEWRSLRLSIKQATVAASIRRAVNELPSSGAVVLAGGAALDDELVRALADSMGGATSAAPVVARANVAGRYGPRCAVAWGLVGLSGNRLSMGACG